MNKQMTGERVWGSWLAGTLGSFAVLEATAYGGHFPTLSVTLCRWLRVQSQARWRHTGPAAFLAFWIAVTIHIARVREIARDAAIRRQV